MLLNYLYNPFITQFIVLDVDVGHNHIGIYLSSYIIIPVILNSFPKFRVSPALKHMAVALSADSPTFDSIKAATYSLSLLHNVMYVNVAMLANQQLS